MTTTIAVIAVVIVIGAWVGIRIADAKQVIERDLTTYLLSIPADEWQEDEK